VSDVHIVDSSGWLEYFTDSDRAALFAAAIEDSEHLLVPVVCLYEVFKKVLRERGEADALQIASVMQGGQLIDLDGALALEAARHPLPLADSIIYATALRHEATLWTQDEHFQGLPNVRYFPRQPAPGRDAAAQGSG
jgi:predicted nucleic acid-binding protein